MNPAKKIYITLAFWGIFTILLISLAIFPLFNNVRKNTQTILSAKKDIVSLDAEFDNLETVRKQYQEYSLNLEKINSLLVNAEVPIDFIRFLEKLGADSNVSILISSGQGQKGDNQWTPLYFQISLTGSHLNFSRFLDKLENSPYLVGVQNMTIRTAVLENIGQGVIANFSIKVLAK